MNNLFNRTDQILSKRNHEITEIETDENALLERSHMKEYDTHEQAHVLDTNEFTRIDELQNYYKVKGKEGFSGSLNLPVDFENLKKEFYGMYKILNGQFLMFDDTYLQIDDQYIGFVRHNVSIFKLKHDNMMPFYSPYNKIEGIKTRIISQDKMVHSIENANLETLLNNIGLNVPNFIYISKYEFKGNDGIIKTYYKLSNRSYTTLMQMEKFNYF
jgi:hypothetical protein